MLKKKIAGILLSGCLVLSVMLSSVGCSLVTVNPERDNAQVIAEIDGEQLTKEAYNNYFAYVCIQALVNDSTMPTGNELKEYKQDLLENLVQIKTLEAKAKKDKIEVKEDEIKKSADEDYKSMQSEVGEGRVTNLLTQNNVTEESFKKFLGDYNVASEYSSKIYEKHLEALKKNPKEETDQVVGKINGEDVKRGVYNYYYINAEFNAYMTTGSGLATDDDSMEKTNEDIFNNIAKTNALIKYAEENEIEIKQEDIDAQVKTLETTASSLFSDDAQLTEFLDNYFLTKKDLEEYRKQEAKGLAAGKAIEKKMVDEAEIKENDIKKKFEEEKKNGEENDTVSAMHILTEDEAYAKEIYNKVKGAKTKEEFKKFMDTYKNDSKVNEAQDYENFDRKKMVQEFTDVAFSIDKNTVSEPVKTEYGYHIIFVYDQNLAADMNYDDEKDGIEKTLKEEKGAEEYTTFEEDLLKKQDIEIYEIKSTYERYYDQLAEELGVVVHTNIVK